MRSIRALLRPLFCITGLLMVSGRLNATTVTTTPPAEATKECRDFIKTLKAANYKYGWFESNEDWKRTNSKKIQIFFYTKLKKTERPILFYYGGPLSLDRYSYLDLPPLLDGSRNKLVFMDQRGTGCSSLVPTQHTEEGLRRASLYGTEGIVEDSEILRKIIVGPSKRWKLFGQSFGGQVISRYIMKYPKSLSTVYGYGSHFFESFEEFYLSRIKAQNTLLTIFGQSNPIPYQRFLKARDLVTDQDCIDSSSGQKVCGRVLFDSYIFSLRDQTRWDRVSKQFSDTLTVDGKVNLASIKKNAEFTFGYFYSPKYIAAQALMRQDINTELIDKRILCQNALNKLSSAGWPESSIVLSECRLLNEAYTPELLQLFESVLPKIPSNPITVDKFLKGLARNPRLRVNLYTGEYDVYSPVDSLKGVQNRSNQIKFNLIDRGDHWSFYDSQKFRDDLRMP